MSERLEWSKTKRTAMFEKNTGSLLSYPLSWGSTEIKDVTEPFFASLRLRDTGRGRSSVLFYWENDTLNKTPGIFPMFVSDMFELLMREDLRMGYGPLHLSGFWRVVKKGANYGIRFISEES